METGLRYDLETRARIDSPEQSNDEQADSISSSLVYDEAKGAYVQPETGYVYDASSGWLMDEANGIYYDLETGYAFDPSQNNLVDEAGTHYDLSTKQKTGDKPAAPPFEIPDGLVWDEVKGAAYQPETGYVYDYSSGWLIDEAGGVYYDLYTGYAYDPDQENLVDMQTGKRYDLQTRQEITDQQAGGR
ncbi:MAG: hypothetical protein LUB61_05035 [Eggerthellaceae bacterium]|nr:hypothetical protein [Eggerthellaceae bacterium]